MCSQIICARSNFPHPICFCSSKEGLNCCAKLVLIWSGWPGQVLDKHLDWKQAGVQESSSPVLAEHKHLATSFPFSDLVAFLHRWPRSYCAKPARIWFGSGWLSGFGRTNPVRKQAGGQELLGLLPSWSRLDANLILHVYWKGITPSQLCLMGPLDLLLQSQVAPDENSAICLSHCTGIEVNKHKTGFISYSLRGLYISHLPQMGESGDAILHQMLRTTVTLFPILPMQVTCTGKTTTSRLCSNFGLCSTHSLPNQSMSCITSLLADFGNKWAESSAQLTSSTHFFLVEILCVCVCGFNFTNVIVLWFIEHHFF